MKKNAEKLAKINNRVSRVEVLFRHFVSNDWCFENSRMFELMDALSPEER
jgi:hypothetical protein